MSVGLNDRQDAYPTKCNPTLITRFVGFRESDIWSGVIVDEATDVRDFLDFFDGNLTDGATGFVTYGIRDNDTNDNEPFLLSQRPNQTTNGTTTPEPARVLALLAVGGLGIASKLKKKSK